MHKFSYINFVNYKNDLTNAIFLTYEMRYSVESFFSNIIAISYFSVNETKLEI